MTSDHPLRRVLASLCSGETMTRIVDPILADMRWADCRPTVSGCLALMKALALHAFTTLPAWSASVWTDDDRAISKVAGLVVAVAVLASIPLIAPPLLQVHQLPTPSSVMLFTLVPQAFALALPSSLAIAIPVALRRVRLNARLLRRTILFSFIVATATCGVIGWIMPDANQRFREAVYLAHGGGQVALGRGPNEASFGTLRRQIADLHHVRGGEPAAATLERNYQTRAALAFAAVPLGAAGLAICAMAIGRRHPVLTGIGVLTLYWVLMTFEQREATASIRDGYFFAVYLCAWTPNLVMLIVSFAILRVGQSPPAAA